MLARVFCYNTIARAGFLPRRPQPNSKRRLGPGSGSGPLAHGILNHERGALHERDHRPPAPGSRRAPVRRNLEKHLDNGVEFTSRNVYIDPEVEIAPGAVILPGCILKGRTKIGAGLRHRPQHPVGEHHRGRRVHRQTPASATTAPWARITKSAPSPMCVRAPSPPRASTWAPMWRPRTPTLPRATPSAT